MKTKRLKITMRSRIYVIFLLCIFLPMMALAVVMSFFFAQKAVNVAKQNTENTLSATARSIEGYLDELERISFTPYLYKDIFEAMRMMNRNVSTSGSDVLTLNRLEENYSIVFTKLLHTASLQVHRIAFYPFAPEPPVCYWVTRSHAGLKADVVKKYEDAAWFQRAQNANGRICYSPFYPVANDAELQSPTFFTASRIIIDSDTAHQVGAMKIDVSPKMLTDVLDGIQIPPNSYLMLLDSENNLLYSAKPVDAKAMQLAQIGNAESFAAVGDYYLAQKDIGTTGWRLVSMTARNDILISNKSAFLMLAAAALIASAAAFLVYRHNSVKVVRSVNAILDAMEEMERGKLNVACEVPDTGELALIAQALGRMGRRLDNHLEKEYRAIVNQRNAEYLALQSQINPHFLYNTLNGFVALNRMGEQKLLEENILELTRLFRYTCNNANHVTLASEFDFVESYLTLQKLRFDERLRFTLSLGENTGDCMIPKLLLQPLVENSIIHGMEKSGTAIHILVKSECEYRHGLHGVLLTVQDDGAGFDTESVISSADGHVGLANITERVMYFSTKGKFEISSAVNKGTECRIWLPTQAKTQEESSAPTLHDAKEGKE